MIEGRTLPKRRHAVRWSATFAATLVAAALSGCGSDGETTLTPTRPTTTAVGGFGLTQTQRDFHLSFDINHPGSRIRILDVQALTSPNVEYLGAVTVWPKDLPGKNIGFGPKFPPAEARDSHQLSEEIPAAETSVIPKPFTAAPAVQVVTGFRLTSGDVGATNGVRVSYEADGKKSTDNWTVAAIACLTPKNCKGPTGSDDPNFETRVLGDAGLLPKD